ncbi:ATP-grasp domain-containing protein [Streptomyces sp. NPDC049916]|uniref:ATP-grasp domain-containing protein n=1 Tax=Streptomyces sp. NPDC049916 TaxID=3155156 RepID=UPI00341F9FEA
MTDRILVCGLGSGMERSLEDLRSPALELVVVTDAPGVRARKAADIVVCCDPYDSAAVLAALSAAGIDRLDGVFSLGADNPPVISAVAHRFGCPGLPLETALNCTLKDRRLEILREAGLDLPRFATATSVQEAERAAADIGLPCVFKPSDRTGSLGVMKVESAREIRPRAAEALRTGGGRIVVEEFLHGTEHTLAGFMADGTLHRFGFADREYGRKEEFAPYFFEGGDTLPSRLTAGQIDEVTETVRRGARALRLDPAVINTDILRTHDGRVVLLEITCRITGARIATEVMRLATGVDPLPNLVRLALGRPLDPAELEPTRDRAVVQRFQPADGGVVEWVGDPWDVTRRPGVHDVFWGMELAPGTVVPPYRGGADVLAGVIAHADDLATAEAIAERSLRTLPLRFKDAAG